jgi:hypothetical protein
MDNVLIVVDDLEAVKAFFIELGLGRPMAQELMGQMQYEKSYRLAYIRGPEGIIVGLAEQLGSGRFASAHDNHRAGSRPCSRCI